MVGTIQPTQKRAYFCYKDQTTIVTRATYMGEYTTPLFEIPSTPKNEDNTLLPGIMYYAPYPSPGQKPIYMLRNYYITLIGMNKLSAKIITYDKSPISWTEPQPGRLIDVNKCEIILTPYLRGQCVSNAIKKYPMPPSDKFIDLNLNLLPIYTYTLSVEFKDPDEYFKLPEFDGSEFPFASRAILFTKWSIA